MKQLQIMMLTGALVCVCGCATVIDPPRQPAEPQPVFLLDHRGHASLVLPNAHGGVTRYSYGDWRWYAQGRKNLFTGVAALFWPTRAGLGRRELPAQPEARAVLDAMWVETRALREIAVEARRVAELQDRLETIYRQNLGTRVFNAENDLELVEHPRAYTAAHNSNRVVADWLAELGCSVRRGCTWFPRWKLQPPSRRQRSEE